MAAVRHLDFAKIENCRFGPSDRYLHVILYLHSEICISRPIWRRDVAKNDFQYGVRPPSWIRKMSFLSNFHAGNGNLYLCTKFARNRIIHGLDMEIKLSYFQNGGRPPSWICENCTFRNVTYSISTCDPSSLFQISRWSANMSPRYSMWFFISFPNFASIGQ